MSESAKDVLDDFLRAHWGENVTADEILAELDEAGYEVVQQKAPKLELPLVPANDNRPPEEWPPDHPFGRPTT